MPYQLLATALILTSIPIALHAETAVTAQRGSTSYESAYKTEKVAAQFAQGLSTGTADVVGQWKLNGTTSPRKYQPDGIRSFNGRWAQTLEFNADQVKVRTLGDMDSTKKIAACPDDAGRSYVCFQYAKTDFKCTIIKIGDLLCRTVSPSVESKNSSFRQYRQIAIPESTP